MLNNSFLVRKSKKGLICPRNKVSLQSAREHLTILREAGRRASAAIFFESRSNYNIHIAFKVEEFILR